MNASGSTETRPRAPTIATFLTFSGSQYGKAEEAIRFYVSLFPYSSVEQLERHGEGEGVPAGELRRCAFTLAGRPFLATESRGDARSGFTPAFSLYVSCRSAEELTALFTSLSKGGNVHMPVGQYPSSDLFVWFDDKYGVSWQLELTKPHRPEVAPHEHGFPETIRGWIRPNQ